MESMDQPMTLPIAELENQAGEAVTFLKALSCGPRLLLRDIFCPEPGRSSGTPKE